VVARKAQGVPALANLARLLAEVGDNEKASDIHERLVALDKSRPERWEQLAHSYRIVGRREDSIKAFRRALAIDPSRGSAWWGLANYFPDQLGDQDQDAIGAAWDQRAGKPDEAALLLALGLIADRAGDYAEAFDRFRAGKATRLRHQPYDPGPISTAVGEVTKLYTPEFYRQRSSAGWHDSSPIFVIGMHRSGTTMVERILGRHSAIEGAGEMRIMPKLAELARREADNPEHYADLLRTLPDEQLAWVGRRYVEASRDYRRSEKRHFIDKNNLNWLQAGLTLLALPDARILDVRRNALDCCWANFKMLFSEGFPATNDLRHVGQFYRDYVRLFDAMKQAAPERILSVRYEDVVDNLEGQTRRMLDFLGLPFESECLDFHLSTGAVATASSEQVRQPLNRRGIGSAEPYRQWLGPLIEELGELADN
jgi:tetratricopeptide (TPR) repeat protein